LGTGGAAAVRHLADGTVAIVILDAHKLLLQRQYLLNGHPVELLGSMNGGSASGSGSGTQAAIRSIRLRNVGVAMAVGPPLFLGARVLGEPALDLGKALLKLAALD
jgi:hypothetical protein